jgi:hypothetical protein
MRDLSPGAEAFSRQLLSGLAPLPELVESYYSIRDRDRDRDRDLGGGDAMTLSDLDQHLYFVVQLVPVDNRRDMPVVRRRTRTYCSRTLISTK